MEILTIRDDMQPGVTLGKTYVNGEYHCESMEDRDGGLERGGTKIPKETAMPRGRYRITLEPSARFGPDTITFNDVPQFKYVRAHGANDANDVEGCMGCGKYRDAHGIHDCKGVLLALKAKVKAAIARGEEVWWEVV